MQLLTLPTQVIVMKGRLKPEVVPPQCGDGLPNKPKHGTGLWTSTYTPDVLSGWIEWCKVQGYSPGWNRPNAYLLTPRPARVFEIDLVRDLKRLVKLYADRTSAVWQLSIKSLVPLDFVALAQDYDAVHLTARGEARTRFSSPYSLYGWDCESTLWLRWMFESDIVHCKTADIITRAIKASEGDDEGEAKSRGLSPSDTKDFKDEQW